MVDAKDPERLPESKAELDACLFYSSILSSDILLAYLFTSAFDGGPCQNTFPGTWEQN